jgi:hypothetical protein
LLDAVHSPNKRSRAGESIETAQLDGQIRPTALNRALEIYESKALEVLSS